MVFFYHVFWCSQMRENIHINKVHQGVPLGMNGTAMHMKKDWKSLCIAGMHMLLHMFPASHNAQMCT